MLQIDEPFYVNLSLHLRWSIKLFGFPLKQELFESTAMLVSKICSSLCTINSSKSYLTGTFLWGSCVALAWKGVTVSIFCGKLGPRFIWWLAIDGLLDVIGWDLLLILGFSELKDQDLIALGTWI